MWILSSGENSVLLIRKILFLLLQDKIHNFVPLRKI